MRSITAMSSGHWYASPARSPTTATARTCFPPCPSARPTMPCASTNPSTLIGTTCAFCTWPRRPQRARWKPPSACSWSTTRFPPLMRCATWCVFPRCQRWVRCTSISRPTTNSCLPSRGGTMPNRQLELQAMLQSLRLPTMAAVCAELALKAAKEGLSHEAFLYELARLEGERRAQQRMERLLAQSGLPHEKTFATFQLDRLPMPLRAQIERLRTGEFVKDATNVVAVGPPGVGKSHVLAAVAHDLVQQGYTVLWTSTAHLMQRLLAAKRDLHLPQELAKLHRYACLVLDDIGYVQHDQDEMEVLFTLLSDRYEQRSVCLSTNLVFSAWERIFKNPLTTVAAIDRVVHHSVILDLMQVRSFRIQQATGQHAPEPLTRS